MPPPVLPLQLQERRPLVESDEDAECRRGEEAVLLSVMQWLQEQPRCLRRGLAVAAERATTQ